MLQIHTEQKLPDKTFLNLLQIVWLLLSKNPNGNRLPFATAPKVILSLLAPIC
jgi:hypothetical protein